MVRNALLLFLVCAGPLVAGASPEGRWDGAVVLPNAKLEVQIDLALDGGAWKGDITIPAQGARDLPLEEIQVDGAKVSFRIAGIPGQPSFRGTLEGDKLAGSFAQGGMTTTFALTRGAGEDAGKSLADFDSFISGTLKPWDVPGLSIAVVKYGKVIYAKGFGQRDVGKNLPMTADTLLPIGSVTKSFTTLVMGTLVDEGALQWDKPLRDYLPEFRAAEDALTARLTVRDLVTHRSGLPRHDLVWYNNQDLTRGELVGRLASLGTSEEIRARYQYNNLMFLTAGHLIEKLTRGTWEDAVRTRVFGPLEMTRSNFADTDSAKDADHARPYREDEGRIREIPFREVGNMGPAGSINSSANEMARYALLHLERGTFAGKKIVEPSTIVELHTPVVAVGVPSEYPDISARSYAMGWFVDSYRAHHRVQHGGNIDGFSALLTLYPNDGVAVVALANANGTGLPGVITNHIADKLLELPHKEWNMELLARRNLAKKTVKEAEGRKTTVRKNGTKASHAIADYAGDYAHEGYGVLKIEKLANDALQATYNHIVTPLEHWHYDVWTGVKNEADPTFADMKYNFRTDLAGNIAEIEAAFEPRVAPILFRKRPDPRLSDPAHLKQYLGNYLLGRQKITVSLRGTHLVMTLSGQPPYDLEPQIDGWFQLKQLTGFRARFTADGLELSQPNGLFVATRAK